MIEHKIITFEENDVIKALEMFYEKTQGQKIDINFDNKAIRAARIKGITIKVVAYNDRIINGNYNGIDVDYTEEDGWGPKDPEVSSSEM